MALTTPGTRRTTSTVTATPAAPRRGRPSKPSVKVIENQQNRRLYGTALGTDEDETHEDPAGETSLEEETRDAKLDQLVQVIGKLNETITQQSCVNETIRTELTEVKTEQQALKTQIKDLQDGVRALRTQLETYSASLPSTRSWASVVSSRGTAQSGYNSNGTTYSEQGSRETNCIRISTQGTSEENNEGNTFTRYLTTDSANKYIRDALDKSDTTKEVHVAGVGTTKTGYVIRFKDGPSTKTARTNLNWLVELGPDTKLVSHGLAWSSTAPPPRACPCLTTRRNVSIRS